MSFILFPVVLGVSFHNKMDSKSKRDIAETILMHKFSQIKPYTILDSDLIENNKDGTFGVSNLAFALYSNGYNLRGRSFYHPQGLLYSDGETLFSIGYYRKEHDSVLEDGYFFFIAPRGDNASPKIKDLAEKICGDPEIHCKGVYVRFLNLNQYKELLNLDFLPAKEHPWHGDSPEEDETLVNSLLRIEDILDAENKIKLLNYGSRNTRRKTRDSYHRFSNFLDRTRLKYTLKRFAPEDSEIAKTVIQQHFKYLSENGKQVGSTLEDYFNLTHPELTSLKSVRCYIGYLGDDPVSYFAGEMVSEKRMALYANFTLRSSKSLLPEVDILDKCKSKGFSAMPLFSYVSLLQELRNRGVIEVLFGGSEHRDLNRIKKQLGCKNNPSYWAVKIK